MERDSILKVVRTEIKDWKHFLNMEPLTQESFCHRITDAVQGVIRDLSNISKRRLEKELELEKAKRIKVESKLRKASYRINDLEFELVNDSYKRRAWFVGLKGGGGESKGV